MLIIRFTSSSEKPRSPGAKTNRRCDRIRPVRELAGFKKIALDPGAAEEVCFEINEEMLRFWTAAEKWESEAGRFNVWVCDSSTDGSPLEFTLEK